MNLKSIWITISVLILLIIALVFPAIRVSRLQTNLKKSRANLKQIGTAISAYHDRYESFPPAYVLGPDGKPWHSWRVLLLPFLEKQELYEKYRWDEPWNGPNNSKLQADCPKVYSSPLQKKPGRRLTTYMAIISRRTIWPAHFSVSSKDVWDGTSNTIQLVENPATDVVWMEPRDLREKDALDLLSPKKAANVPEKESTNFVLMADGAVRAVSTRISRDTVVSLLTPQYRHVMVSDEFWPAGLLADDDLADWGMPDLIDLEKLSGTAVLATPDASVDPEKTAVYCATLQLAWDQLRPEAGQAVFVKDATPVTESLNLHPFPTAFLSPESYFAGIAGLNEQEGTQLHEQFRSKFPNAPTEALNVPQELEKIGGLRILTYLQKTMPFPEVMQRIDEPLRFCAVEVKSFGMLPLKDATSPAAFDQTVQIANYWSDDEFIVTLKTETRQGDQIILAKVASGETLGRTWEFVSLQMQNSTLSSEDSRLHTIDRLQIPILSVGLIAPIEDLIGLRIPTTARPERYIEDVRQTIRFRLDEHGAILESDTYAIVADDEMPASHPRPKPRNFVFDRPFLIALRELNAEQPYFLAWIGNTDFLDRLPNSSKK